MDVISGLVKHNDPNFKLDNLFELWVQNKEKYQEDIQKKESKDLAPRKIPNFFWQFLMCLKRAL